MSTRTDTDADAGEYPPHGTGALPTKDVGRLLLRCADRPGLVAAVSSFLTDAGANIVSLDQHATEQSGGTFMQRTIFHLPGLTAARDGLERDFTEDVASRFEMDFRLTEAAKPKRVVILASKEDHCLLDLLWRNRRGELDMSVSMVVSNHPELAEQVRPFGVPFIHVPATKDTRADAEQRLLDLLRGNADLVVLARYMQILTHDFLADVGCPLINIHHSFLPAFIGAAPYRRAKERGVETRRGDRALRHRGTRRRADHRAGRGACRSPALGRRPDPPRRGRREGGAVARGALALSGPDHPVRQPDGRVLVPRRPLVDRDLLCGDQFRVVAGQPAHCVGDVLGLATQVGRNGVSMFMQLRVRGSVALADRARSCRRSPSG